MTVLRDGEVGEVSVGKVSVGKLNRSTSRVLRAVRTGERLIVTRHGQPQAVLLSMSDAIELLVEPELPALAVAAERDFREGRVEAVEPPGPCPVVLAQAAADSYVRMTPRDRFELRLAAVRGLAEEGTPVWLKSRRWIISVLYLVAESEGTGHETVVVCGAFEVRELERELIGEEIWDARARRHGERMLHARDLERLPA
jgi:prevent-host-death family protein